MPRPEPEDLRLEVAFGRCFVIAARSRMFLCLIAPPLSTNSLPQAYGKQSTVRRNPQLAATAVLMRRVVPAHRSTPRLQTAPGLGGPATRSPARPARSTNRDNPASPCIASVPPTASGCPDRQREGGIAVSSPGSHSGPPAGFPTTDRTNSNSSPGRLFSAPPRSSSLPATRANVTTPASASKTAPRSPARADCRPPDQSVHQP